MYQNELQFFKSLFIESYRLFCGKRDQIFSKAAMDIVTATDLDIEKYVTEKIMEAYPQDHIHSEEFHSNEPLTDRTWIIDPIDGTFNFSTKSPHFGLQGAFWDKGELQFSVIYLPQLNELYEAVLGKGAFLNSERITVSKRNLENSIVSFGDFPHSRPKDAEDQMKAFTAVRPKIAKIRMFGASSVDFSYFASGRTEGVVLFTKNKWDIAPGLLLAKEAGAITLDENGNPYTFESRSIFAVNSMELYHSFQ